MENNDRFSFPAHASAHVVGGLDDRGDVLPARTSAKGRASMGTPLQETVDNYLFRRKDLMAILFSRLIAFVECCVAVPANRIGSKTMTLEQGIRYLSREEKVRHITGRP